MPRPKRRSARHRLLLVGLLLAPQLGSALAQSAGGSGSSGAGGSAGSSGQVQGDGRQSRRQDTGLDATTPRNGVAGTGMGGTTPAMRSDTSVISGNGLSVRRPDPGAANNGTNQGSLDKGGVKP